MTPPLWAVNWTQLSIAVGFMAAAVTVVFSLYRNSPIGAATIQLLRDQNVAQGDRIKTLEATLLDQSAAIADKDDAIRQAEKETLEREKTIAELQAQPKFEQIFELQQQMLETLEAVRMLVDREHHGRTGDI